MTKGWRGAIVLGLAVALIPTCSPAKLVGDPLPGALAPDFTLTDGPTGETVTLSALRGRVILVTFLYTSCYDICPLTAETIRGARDRLGNSATDVAFLAVSVDPKGDTPETTRRFVQDHRVEGTLRYLIGPQAALARVWQAYGIAQAGSTRDGPPSDGVYLLAQSERPRGLPPSRAPPR